MRQTMETEKTNTANALTVIRDKFLRKIGLYVKNVNGDIDEQKINGRVLTPLCAIDMAYEAFQEIDKSYFRQDTKMLYNGINKKFHAIFSAKNGVIYKGLTEKEIYLLIDYMEKIAEEVKHETEILKWQIMGHLMDFPVKEREIVCKLIYVMTICCYSYDMIERDLHKKFVEIEFISRTASRIVDAMLKQLFGRNAPDLVFTDEVFVQTLTILFNKLSRLTTEGVA